MSNAFLFFGFVVVIAVVVLVLVIRKMKKRGMANASQVKVAAAWKHAVGIGDPIRRIMEADKVLDLALSELGFKGTLGEKLKKAGPRFSNINDVWRAHKLRNTLAHETGAQVSAQDAASAMRSFERGINDLF